MVLELTSATSPAPQAEPRARPAAAESRSPAKSVSRPANLESTKTSSLTRLNYDEELSRTFIEVIDRDSGAVVAKFPPEELVRYVQEVLAEAPGTGASLGHLYDARA